MDNTSKLKFLSKYYPYGLRVTLTEDKDVDVAVRGLTKDYVITSAENRYPLNQVVPILRPFDHLTKTVWYQGRAVVPVVEIAKLAIDLEDEEISSIGNSFQINTEPGSISVEFNVNSYTQYIFYICEDGFQNEDPMFIGVSLYESGEHKADRGVKNLLYIFNMLYELQFALGVPKHEYQTLEEK